MEWSDLIRLGLVIIPLLVVLGHAGLLLTRLSSKVEHMRVDIVELQERNRELSNLVTSLAREVGEVRTGTPDAARYYALRDSIAELRAKAGLPPLT